MIGEKKIHSPLRRDVLLRRVRGGGGRGGREGGGRGGGGEREISTILRPILSYHK